VIEIEIKEVPIRTASSVRNIVQLVVRSDQVNPEYCTIYTYFQKYKIILASLSLNKKYVHPLCKGNMCLTLSKSKVQYGGDFYGPLRL
jgi:hypothetical protein